MVTKDSVEAAYCFFHQKWRVYQYSNSPQQKDDIEYAIALYVDSMNDELYAILSDGNPDFLMNHNTFASNILAAINALEVMIKKMA